MNALLLSLIPLLSAPTPAGAAAAPRLDCDHVAERSATVPARGADLARIVAAAGELRIVGRPGLDEVRIRGRACSSHRRYLEQIELVAERDGDEVRVEARMPRMRGLGSFQARLDLVVEVPAALALDVRDSSGDVEIREVGALRLDDSSGDVRIELVRGDLRVEDSSGDVRAAGIAGDVWLRDSSGRLEVREVQGGVVVDADSSGDIEVTDVRRDVLVRRDSSGDVRVARVGGDFRVDRDGSGDVSYRDVAGGVRVPDDGE